MLINPKILKYPDFEKPFILTTDASNYALGAVLSQGEIGDDSPIAYASRTLIKSELNKPIIEKELLGIHWGINYFRPYLFGKKFICITDHRPLVSLFTHKNPSSKMTRIRMDLCDYHFDIIYKPGKLNSNADALSRIKLDSDILKSMIPCSEVMVMTRAKSKLIDAQASSEEIINQEILKRNAANNKYEKGYPITDEIKNTGSTISEKSGQLFIWDATSISDIRNIMKAQFLEDNNCSIRLLKNDTYVQILFSVNENPKVYFAKLLEKLMKKLNLLNIKIIAIAKDDIIFNYIKCCEFKKMFKELQLKNLDTRDQRKKAKLLKIILYEKPVKITDVNTQKEIIKNYHDSKLGGHTGVKRTINKIKQRYIWKNMSKMVKNYVSSCVNCKKNKVIRHRKEPLVITETPNESFQIVSIDTIGPLYPSNGYKYIVTIQCELTKYLEAFPVTNKDAVSVANGIVKNFILRYGSFKILKSDMGTEYVNSLMKNITEAMEIKHVNSTAYHHETMGGIERTHRVFNEYFRNFSEQDDWDNLLPYFVFAYNVTPNSDSDYSPYELVFGKVAKMPNDLIDRNFDTFGTFYNYDDYAKQMKFRLKRALCKAKEMLDIAKYKRKISYDTNTNSCKELKVGDFVYINKPCNKKLENVYEGPYEIIERNNVNSKINKNGKIIEIHNNRIK